VAQGSQIAGGAAAAVVTRGDGVNERRRRARTRSGRGPLRVGRRCATNLPKSSTCRSARIGALTGNRYDQPVLRSRPCDVQYEKCRLAKSVGASLGPSRGVRIALPSYWREFVFVGLLGGFTTFSTFGLDTFVLARTHSLGYAVINVAAQVIGGLVVVWLGYRLSV